MNRLVALSIVGLFAAGGAWSAWLGLSDLIGWRQDIANCAPVLALDNSSFWLIGFCALALLVLLGFSSSEKVHAAILASAVVFFLALPALGYSILSSDAANQGYDWQDAPTLFSLEAYEVPLEGSCERADDGPLVSNQTFVSNAFAIALRFRSGGIASAASV